MAFTPLLEVRGELRLADLIYPRLMLSCSVMAFSFPLVAAKSAYPHAALLPSMTSFYSSAL